MDEAMGVVRYAVRYDQFHQKWVVVDSAVADEVIGIHETEHAARNHADVEESRWFTLGPLSMCYGP